ncbi:MAG: hypothetical protein AAFV53_39690 [Myxococcota bacterium]
MKPVACPDCNRELSIEVDKERLYTQDWTIARCSSLTITPGTHEYAAGELKRLPETVTEHGCGAELFVQYAPHLEVRIANRPDAVSQFVWCRLAGVIHQATLRDRDVGPDGRAFLLVAQSLNEAIAQSVIERYGTEDDDFFEIVLPMGALKPADRGEGYWSDDPNDDRIYTRFWITEHLSQPAFISHRRGEEADLRLVLPHHPEYRAQVKALFPDVDFRFQIWPIKGARQGLEVGCWWPHTPEAGVPLLPSSILEQLDDEPRPLLEPRPGWRALSALRWQRDDGLMLSLSEGNHPTQIICWMSHPDIDDWYMQLAPELHNASLLTASETLDGKSLEALSGRRLRRAGQGGAQYVGGWRLSGLRSGEDHRSASQVWTRPGPGDGRDARTLERPALLVETTSDGAVWTVSLPYLPEEVPAWADVLRRVSVTDPGRTVKIAIREAVESLKDLIAQRHAAIPVTEEDDGLSDYLAAADEAIDLDAMDLDELVEDAVAADEPAADEPAGAS